MRIYLDHNATTPLRDEVIEAVQPWLREGFGNPSSAHAEGARARAAIERARDEIAACVGAEARDVIFTAGATEANNTALHALLDEPALGGRLVVSATEHPSVLEPAEWLATRGVRVTCVAVAADGRLDLGAFEAAMAEGPALAALILANNETGVLHPVAEAGAIVREAGGRLHVDATQALGKWPVDLAALGAHSAAFSAHKLNGPKGVGALVAREGGRPAPLLRGGPQERRARGGTENVAGIAGFGAACALARAELDARRARYAALRDRLWRGLVASAGELRRNGGPSEVLPNTLNVELVGAAGEALVQALDLEGVSVSLGAACHSGSVEPSHVLAAMGRSPAQARASLRFSVGHGVDESQIDRAVELVARFAAAARREASGGAAEAAERAPGAAA